MYFESEKRPLRAPQLAIQIPVHENGSQRCKSRCFLRLFSAGNVIRSIFREMIKFFRRNFCASLLFLIHMRIVEDKQQKFCIYL